MLVTLNPTISYTQPVKQKPVFCGNRFKYIKDIFIKSKNSTLPRVQGLSKITGITGRNVPGTTCNGAVTMKNFWAMVDPDTFDEIYAKGISTNNDGFPHCFLKAKADVPISTSFVHDCSVMYLYNKRTNTHALYHAAYDCEAKKIDFMLKTLMPEGITHGSITPGDSYWSDRHVYNLKNMFASMKRYNKNAIVNVYSESSKYPEIVGYNGKTYEILNKDVQNQLALNGYASDNGQASFRIVDLQGYNTFDRIEYNCKSLKDIKKLKHYFKKIAYNEEMIGMFHRLLAERAMNIKTINACKSIEESYELEQLFEADKLDNYWDVFRIKRENFLLKELQTIKDKTEFIDFYKRVINTPSHTLMKRLNAEIDVRFTLYNLE